MTDKIIDLQGTLKDWENEISNLKNQFKNEIRTKEDQSIGMKQMLEKERANNEI